MSKRVISVVLISGGLLLIMAAFALICYNIWDDTRAGNEANSVLGQIDNLRTPHDDSDMLIPDYILNPEMDMPAVEINGYRYIGTVSVPALEIELPVMENWSYPQMQIAPCRYSGSAYLNNFVICAHNYASHFGRIKNLQQGDSVIFTDMDSNVFKYKVKKIESLSSTAVEDMKSGDWDLTLFTCTISGQARVTVRCSDVDK